LESNCRRAMLHSVIYRCGAKHTGGTWNCSDCSICCRWHKGDDCFDTHNVAVCAANSISLSLTASVHCTIDFIQGKDCLPFHATDHPVRNFEWSAASAAPLLVPSAKANAAKAKSRIAWRGAGRRMMRDGAPRRAAKAMRAASREKRKRLLGGEGRACCKF
jgi:hypothetical protein